VLERHGRTDEGPARREKKITCRSAGGEDDCRRPSSSDACSGRAAGGRFPRRPPPIRSPGRAHERGSLVFISTPRTVVDRAWIFARSFTRATGSKFSVSKVYICYTPSYRGSTRDALTIRILCSCIVE
jgi:hypothetical protein